MNLLHLQYFYVVAKEQGFTKASKVLRIQQPAISRMVKLLEEDLGLKLFEKFGRNVRLTREGQEVFEYCKRIFGTVEDLKQSLSHIARKIEGPLRLAAAEPIASHFLPAVLSTYLSKYPTVHPHLFSAPASALFDQLIDGELEFGIFFHIPDLSEKLEIFETQQVEFHLVVRKDLRKSKEIFETFIGSREIDDISTRRFPTLERLRKNFPKAQINISSNNLTAHRQMVIQGLGVSILPDFLISEDIKSGLVVDVFPKEKFEFQMKFIKRKNAILSSAAKEFIRLCIER